jgi:hypothetical protein
MMNRKIKMNPLHHKFFELLISADMEELKQFLIHETNFNINEQIHPQMSQTLFSQSYMIYEFKPMEEKKVLLDLLLSYAKPNLNQLDITGSNILLKVQDPQSIELLIEHGIDFENYNQYGINKIIQATEELNEEVFDILIRYGANVNAQSKITPFTPPRAFNLVEILLRQENTNFSMVKKLYEHGFNQVVDEALVLEQYKNVFHALLCAIEEKKQFENTLNTAYEKKMKNKL